MRKKLYTPAQVADLINSGKKLLLTADEKLLLNLPKGDWIGGTIPYFMDTEGGILTKDHIFVDDFTELGINFKIVEYQIDTIQKVGEDAYENGFSALLLPGNSQILQEFATHSAEYENIFDNPVIGYVTGVDLSEMETAIPKVVNGKSLTVENKLALCMHVELPKQKIARTEIVNIFKPKQNTAKITFENTGFTQTECYINGEKRFLSDYINEQNHDIQYPLVANKAGALINKSFQSINKATKQVSFYAPIEAGEEYRLAEKVDDYSKKFSENIKHLPKTEFSCNCILNHIYGEFEGKKVKLNWQTTFGEIAYMLLNQTLVYLTIDEIS